MTLRNQGHGHILCPLFMTCVMQDCPNILSKIHCMLSMITALRIPVSSSYLKLQIDFCNNFCQVFDVEIKITPNW